MLDMEVDEALKMIISLGVVVPTWPRADRRIAVRGGQVPEPGQDREWRGTGGFAPPCPDNPPMVDWPYHSASFFRGIFGTSDMRSHYCGQIDQRLDR